MDPSGARASCSPRKAPRFDQTSQQPHSALLGFLQCRTEPGEKMEQSSEGDTGQGGMQGSEGDTGR